MSRAFGRWRGRLVSLGKGGCADPRNFEQASALLNHKAPLSKSRHGNGCGLSRDQRNKRSKNKALKGRWRLSPGSKKRDDGFWILKIILGSEKGDGAGLGSNVEGNHLSAVFNRY